MIFFPAIDIYKGFCVRLEKGDFEKKTIFNKNPLDQAKIFQDMGCDWIHIVDLDGAKNGNSDNFDIVKEIALKTDLKIQFGGGVRTSSKISSLINSGIDRVIIGTKAIDDISFLEEACKDFPNKIAIGIDARKGKVSIEGWTKDSGVSANEFAVIAESKGVCAIIFTDIDKDGVMEGPNIGSTLEIAKSVNIPVIVSGGVSSIKDVLQIKNNEKSGIGGMICGRAVYDKKVDIREALTIVKL
ncbi:MAG: 1-(5-phosphoribosyl)-5-[(5-phosphoribosylamino)methylideneamino]imidazole-4-carboxamide isomerase [Alphaproteobacteria bacterium]